LRQRKKRMTMKKPSQKKRSQDVYVVRQSILARLRGSESDYWETVSKTLSRAAGTSILIPPSQKPCPTTWATSSYSATAVRSGNMEAAWA
jgi:hypothetical protein